MPSPCPGMDPFLEGDEWEDFHVAFIEGLRGALVPRVRPRYILRAERRIYLEHQRDEKEVQIRPDLAVLRPNDRTAAPITSSMPSQAAAPTPLLLHLPMPEEIRETFLTIRLRESLEIITVVEVLSPTNKRHGSDGRRKYLAKRERVLRSATHLVEMDLLRGGERLPTRESLPRNDFFAFVSRGRRRPSTEVYPWNLKDRLPAIPIPLAPGDPDVILELQPVFDTVYDRAGYDYSLDYSATVEPPLSDADAAWVRSLLPRKPSSGEAL